MSAVYCGSSIPNSLARALKLISFTEGFFLYQSSREMKAPVFFFFFANYSNFQALWMLTQKLFNTQLGGKGGIHNLKSQTGLSTAGQQCENKHAAVTTMWLCVKINTQVWALGSRHGESLGRMRAGAGRVLLTSPALSNLQENPSSRMVRPCTEPTKCDPLSLKCLQLGDHRDQEDLPEQERNETPNSE